MSYTFTLTGATSILRSDFNPPIFLDQDDEYVLGLTSFETFNGMQNITSNNNRFLFGNKMIVIPAGAYEIREIGNYINSHIPKGHFVELHANNSTLRSVIKGTQSIDFTIEHSLGPLLGFEKKLLTPHKSHESENPINILKVNSLLIDCNITTGNYKNGDPAHILHQFFPNVPAGYKIIECPLHVTYLPINVKTISNITIKIVDQDGEIVSFGKEVVTIGLHLKKLSYGFSV